MNPGPGFGGGPGIDAAGVGQVVVTVLVLGGIVAFGVLVLRRLGAIERAVRDARPAAAVPVAAPPVPQPDADQRAWQQEAPVAQPVVQQPDGEGRAPQLREGPSPA